MAIRRATFALDGKEKQAEQSNQVKTIEPLHDCFDSSVAVAAASGSDFDV